MYNIVLQIYLFFGSQLPTPALLNCIEKGFTVLIWNGHHWSLFQWVHCLCMLDIPIAPVLSSFSSRSAERKDQTVGLWIITTCFYAFKLWSMLDNMLFAEEWHMNIDCLSALSSACKLYAESMLRLHMTLKKVIFSTKVSGHMWCAKICKLWLLWLRAGLLACAWHLI